MDERNHMTSARRRRVHLCRRALPHLDASGRWVGRPRSQHLRRAAGGYGLTLPSAGAALVSMRLRST